MSEEILPCPFCGKPGEMNVGDFGERFVTCSNNNCGGRLGAGIWFAKEEDAIALWNTRAYIPEIMNVRSI